MEFTNVCEDTRRAESYSRLEFPGTYYLACRDLPEIIAAHVKGKAALFGEFGTLLKDGGCVVHLCSSPEIYWHEWASFTTKDFPENRRAKTGDKVKIIMNDVDDRRPVEDILWMPEAYIEVFRCAGLRVVQTYRPLGKEGEPATWVNETAVAPWTIYVLDKA